MAVRLTVRQRGAGAAEKATEVLLDDDIITLGRDKSCQVVLAQMAVSRSHARITRDGSLFFVEDLGSAYGTTINGKALPKGEKRLLRNGDLIAIAQFDVTFDRVADAPAEGSSDKTSFIARHVVKDVMRGLGVGEGPYFRVMNGPREGQRIEIQDAQELVIGREDGVDVVLKDDLVSRRHAKIRRDWSGTHVEDLGSRNGIRVNRKRVTRKTLKDRDELEIGATRLLYIDPSEVRETPLVLGNGTEEAEEPAAQSAPDPQPSDQHPVEAAAESTAAQDEPAAEAESSEEADDSESAEEASEDEAAEEQASDDEEEDESEDESLDEDEPADDDEEEEDEEDLPPRRQPSKGRGKKSGRSAALNNITIVVKDVRRLVPIVVMGIAAILAIVLVIAIFAGA
ncbi:MAG: FHA domain-containing protein [Myxococcaceae bacterium]|nr:FHA domain-containing protein [Myxococcaceae bacterium]